MAHAEVIVKLVETETIDEQIQTPGKARETAHQGITVPDGPVWDF